MKKRMREKRMKEKNFIPFVSQIKMVMNLHQEIELLSDQILVIRTYQKREREIMRERKKKEREGEREKEREEERFASSINHTLDSPHLNKYNDE